MSDIVSDDSDINQHIFEQYKLIPIPTMLENYPIQGWVWVIKEKDLLKQQQAQTRITKFLAISLA